jgi:hypothetical protein
MSAKTEGNYLPDWLKRVISELWPAFYTEEVTIASGQNLVCGQLVGKITATGEYAAYDDDGADNGCRTAAGILTSDVDATDGALPGVILVRGPAVISKAGLTGSDANGLADLAALEIIAKEGV